MQPPVLDEIEQEIERLRRRYATALREWPNAREASARWAVEVTGLRWFVPLEDVVEADIDVEILNEVLIVRASRAWPEPAVLVSILPVPSGFDSEPVSILFSEETLEVRIRRVERRMPR
jgi:hypothetical protein